MFRNQYLVVSEENPRLFHDQTPVFTDGLQVYANLPLNLTTCKNADITITLIGYILNPLQPEATNTDIIKALVDKCANLEAFFREIQMLSGRYVLIYHNSIDFIVVGDACNLRHIFYGFVDNRLVLTSSVKMFLDYFGYEVQINNSKKDFIALPKYSKSESSWYGNSAIDDRLKKLLPNHYFDLNKKETRRIPFTPHWRSINEAQISDYASSILRGTYASLARRYNLLHPLTAGWDTRILLAASKAVKDQIQYYVFANPNNTSPPPDVWVPKNLQKKLDLNFQVIATEPLRQDFLTAFQLEHVFPRILPKTANIQYHYDHHSDQQFINVNGNGGEIVRCFYGRMKGKVDLDVLLTFSGYGNKSPFLTEELNTWLADSIQYSKEINIPLLDLFYWEQRIGNWGAFFPFEQDIAIEEISPFNNRELIHSLLLIPPEKRSTPNYTFFRQWVDYMWADTLSEPVNPDENALISMIKGNSLTRYWATKASGWLNSLRG